MLSTSDKQISSFSVQRFRYNPLVNMKHAPKTKHVHTLANRKVGRISSSEFATSYPNGRLFFNRSMFRPTGELIFE